MLAPRWRKIARDIWHQKARALLIVLSITVGVFAVGTVAHMHVMVSRYLDESYAAVNPAHITITTSETFPAELTPAVRRLAGVAGATAQRRLLARFRIAGSDQSFPIELIALEDYRQIDVNIIKQELQFDPDLQSWPPGDWPPPRRGVVLERTSLLVAQLGLVGSKLGDSITIEMPDGAQREVRLVGLAYDFSQIPATFAGHAYGFVTLDMLEALGQSRDYNTLQLRASDASPAAIADLAARARRQIERSGVQVATVELHQPGKLPLDYVFRAIGYVLGALGLLALVLSGFLIINTISALLGQQVRQIGVMKAIGARGSDLAAMYLVMVAVFGLVAVLVAMPLASMGAQYFANFLSFFLNFQMRAFRTPPEVVLFEFGMGLLVPLLAGLLPVWTGTRITVREALGSYGTSALPQQLLGWFERLRWLPRTIAMIVRNSLRQRARLLLTLATLVVASAAFVAVLSLRASMTNTVDQAFSLWQYDVFIQLREPTSLARIARASQGSGASAIEGWLDTVVYRVRGDELSSAPIVLVGPPLDSRMLRPTLLQGRWLQPGDTDALVIDSQTLQDQPDLTVSQRVTLELRGRTSEWLIVGVVQTVGATHFAYANYEYVARLMRQTGQATRVQALVAPGGDATALATALEARLRDANIEVSLVLSTAELRAQSETLFTIITTLLLAMALLLAAVGGLGLTGTMSLNVLERTREIGVLRAIGAPNRAIMGLVIGEGLFIGLLSWLIGTILAFPLGYPLCTAIGLQFFQSPLFYSFSWDGALLWLVLMLGLAALASWLPAQRATQLRVRDALAYDG